MASDGQRSESGQPTATTHDPVAHERELAQTVERLEREVAEHRRTAEQLRATESTMQAILDLTDASVFAKDLDGRYLIVNPKGAEIMGLVPADVVGRTDEELYTPEQAQRFRDHDVEVIRSGTPKTAMMPLPRPSGEEIWLSHLVPLVDVNGEITGTAGIATDVTEQARRELLLQQRTQQLLSAQRIARIGSWSWHLDTDALEISDELERILGRSAPDRWTITDLSTLTHPDDLAATVQAVLEARDGAEIDHLFRIRRPDGAVRWLQLRSESAGDDSVVVGTVQDVTEREEAEQQRVALEHRLQQTQRLETVGQLAGGVAHDFNNLLAVLAMQADLALEAVDAHHAAAEQLRDLRSTIDQASALTRQLLVFSRHDDHDQAVIDVGASIERLVPLLDRSLGTGIELHVDLAGDLRPVRADRSQLEQVIVNIAVNARDAMIDGGTLTITGQNDDGHVRLAITDTGTGMPGDVLEHAVEPFFTTKPPGIGTGLGLATVHGIVTRAGGTVEIASEPGVGTSVEIVLPASDDPATADIDSGGAEEPPAAVVDDQTVLIVEDLEPLGKLAATVLGRAGYRTLLATDGAHALELVADTPIDLVLTDVVMPNMSGRELVAQLRVERPDLPVVYMTGYTAGMLDLESGDDGADVVVLSKPFTTAELVATVAARLAAGRRSTMRHGQGRDPRATLDTH